MQAQQNKTGIFQNDYQLHIKKAKSQITIDGDTSEPDWNAQASVAKDFWEHFPNDQESPKRKTEVKMLYDDEYIYLAAVSYDTNHYVIQTLKRDSRPFDSDGFGIVLDPVNQRTNGFFFMVSPYNVQTEDLLTAFISSDLNLSWDNKWLSATKRYDDRWVAEIAIPFKTLRYDPSKTKWGINFLRSDPKNNQYSTWTRFPVNFSFYDFGYTGSLIWDQPPPKAGTNLSFIPYVTGSVAGDKENGEPMKGKFNGGFDGKIGVSSSLNLDLTVNPDFSQVEVDQQVTNLTRFDVFFPEKRTFFLENDDIFSGYGIPPIRPFYSRSIGLDKDGNKIPIIAGARLSGNLSKKFRLGVMNMQTLAQGEFASQNYTAISFNQSVQNRSVVSGYFLNRQGFMNDEQLNKNPLDKFGRNAGLQYSFSDKAGKWQAWGAYHASFKPNISQENHYIEAGGAYFGRKFSYVIDYGDVTTNYYADMGFILRIENEDAKLDTSFRLGFKEFYSSTEFKWYPVNQSIVQHRITMENFIVLNPDNSYNEINNNIRYQISFRNTAALQLIATNNIVDLKYYTDFTDNKQNEPLPPGKYNYTVGKVNYISDGRKKIFAQGGIQYGSFYNGTIMQITASLGFRAQPWGNFTLNFENDDIKFPVPYGSAKLFLISPRIEINFSNSLFWTTFLQYNTQENNFNINSRIQWRYKPMSDVYLVYTDNYFTDPLFKNKNRAIVFKMNYWLNL